MFSYWEKNTWFSKTDICIIGAGIVGLNAAIQLKKIYPHKSIIVLERGMLPCGASTKNAGFACFGSPGELVSDLDSMTELELRQLIGDRLSGLNLLRKNLGDQNIGYMACGGSEIFSSSDNIAYQKICERLPDLNRIMKDVSGLNEVFYSNDQQIDSFGFEKVTHMISNQLEGQIDTGKMMHALLEKAKETGVQLFFGAQVNQFNAHETKVEIEIANYGSIISQHIVFTTNGFISHFLPELKIQPGRAQVLITEPIPQLTFNHCFHYQEGYFYFRNVGNRILFGGGRNLDKVTETTQSHEVSPFIQETLDKMLHEMIAPRLNVKVEMRWAGTLGLGPKRKPIVKQTDTRVFVAAGMGGMGVALGSLTGLEVADLLKCSI